MIVFPEGTRTHDGEVARFHKGAFVMAEQLGLEILPVYIHGAYDVWPRQESLMTKGQITVSVGERCSLDNRSMRAQFIAELGAMGTRLETPEYKREIAHYENLYKGRSAGKEAVK